jgi:hypothetical protein
VDMPHPRSLDVEFSSYTDSSAASFPWPTLPLAYGGQVFSESKALRSIQSSTSWGHAAQLALGELTAMVEQMGRWADVAQTEEGDPLHLDEQFQRYKHKISRLIDGESGRFEAEALFEGAPLFLGKAPQGVTPIQLYTGFGRPGFPTLSFLARLGDRPASSRIEGRAEVINTFELILDSGASSIEGVYEGKQICVRGERGLQITVVASYSGAKRIVGLADRVNQALVGRCPTYCLESEICNRTLVGEGEIAVADFIWGGLKDQERRTALFDVEHGNLLTPDAARAMRGRIQRINSRLAAIVAQLQSEIATLQQERSLVDWMQRWERTSRSADIGGIVSGWAVAEAHGPLSDFERMLQQN